MKFNIRLNESLVSAASPFSGIQAGLFLNLCLNTYPNEDKLAINHYTENIQYFCLVAKQVVTRQEDIFSCCTQPSCLSNTVEEAIKLAKRD